MAAPTLQSLCTPLTPEQVRSFIYSALGKVGIDTTAWQPGSVVRTLVAVISTLFSAYTYWASAAIQGTHLLLASGDWLDAVALYDYATTRNPATYASGPVTLTNTGAGVYKYEPGELSITFTKAPADGTSTPLVFYYTNSETVNVSGNQTQTIQIQAQQQGSAPNYVNGSGGTFAVAGNTYLTITTTTSILGADAETDQSLKNRALQVASSLSPNGPSEAYTYVATNVQDANGSPYCTKAKVVLSTPGNVTLYVAGPDASLSGTVGDATTPLGAVNQAIQTNVVPLGVTCTPQSCTALNLAIGYTVWVSRTTSLSDSAITSAIYDAINVYLHDFPIGGFPALNDAAHATSPGWIYIDQVKAIIEESLKLPGINNPIFHVSMTVTTNDTQYVDRDIPCRPSDVAQLQSMPPGTVNRQ